MIFRLILGFNIMIYYYKKLNKFKISYIFINMF